MAFRKLATALLLALTSLGAVAQVAGPDPLVVTTTADNAANPTVGMLRYAINFANSICSTLASTIKFDIAGAGPHTIQPAGPLPAITCANTTIDGYTQPFSAVTPVATPNTDSTGGNNANIQIILNGSACVGASPCAGLRSTASNVFIKGLAIHSFAGAGVSVDGGSAQVYGNYIGTDPGRVNPFPNGVGINVTGGQLSAGSGAPADMNLIAGNTGAGILTGTGAQGAFISGNLIGGMTGMGNGGAGVELNDPFTHLLGGNYIRYNGGAGILVNAGTVTATINPRIFGNGDKGIRYNSPAPYPPPRIMSYLYDSANNVTTLTIQMSGGPASSISNEVDIYTNSSLPPFGEGEQFVDNVGITLDGNGAGTTTVTVPGRVDNPTATFSYCGRGCLATSEFSAPDFPPQLSLVFSPDPLAMGNSGTLTMVLSNPNKTVRTISQVAFSFTLPSGLTIGPESAGTDCAPGFSVAGASSTVAAVSNVTLAPSATCTLTATVTPSSGGTYNIAAGSITVASDAGAGTNSAASLTVTTTPGISVTPSSLAFGTIQSGTSSALTVTVQSTGTAPLSVSGANVTGAGFSVTGNTCTAPINAPGTCTITVTFSPTTVGTFSGTLAILSSATPSPLNVPLTGAGGAPGLQFTPATVTFVAQNVGTTSAPKTVTLTNTGSTALNISSIAITGDFGYTGCGFPLTLAPGGSCTFSITFSPQANGTLTGSISVVSNGPGSPNVLPLTGTGVNGPTPGISVQPFGLGLGPIRVGTQGTGHVSVISNGTAPLSISSIAVTGAFFSQSNACPATLAVGASCDVTVTYSPGAVGTHVGQLTIQSNGSPATLNVGLTGSALAQLPAALLVPDAVDFGPQVLGSSTRQGIDLRNTGEQTLNIASLVVQGAGFRLEGACASIAPGGTCSVTLVFEPTAVASYIGTVRIASNDARGTVSVRLSGQGIAVPRPVISVTPDGIGFANQMITTQSASQGVTVRNVGTAPLHIRGVSVTGPFTLGGSCPATLAPEAQCNLTVSFVPTVAGGSEGRLTVDSDAESGRGFVSLTGSGCRFFSVAGMRNLQRLCTR